ncbi:hypothetical protein FB45DRAFT_475398 [Roridomyces roridus]|uniref:Uncharacterized protein n=1 Tax=Roridomyces roridus TaxID=1738132 RepID=A0AAD7BZC8_9AGAR|nr:hypothetical protein FB45DRAFT_475398 [Roridomyces roridus]
MNPTWKDSVYATLSSCFPCTTRPHDASQSDDENDNPNNLTDGARYAIRRARADELEGLLADADRDDAAADADAISLHSHLGPRGRRRAPPRTPKHISFWGFSLFGSGRTGGVALPTGDDDVLHRRRRSEESTDRLLADAAAGPSPRELADAEIERRARRRARKEMRRLAKAAAAQQYADTQDPTAYFNPQQEQPSSPPIPAQFLMASSPPPPTSALQHMQAQDDEDAADLDGVSYARLVPRPRGAGGSRSSGRSSNSGSNSTGLPFTSGGPEDLPRKSSSKKSKSKSKRSTKSGSSATSSTLASPSTATFPQHTQIPYQQLGKHVDVGMADESFDGTPGGLDYGEFVAGEAEEFDGSPGGLGPFEFTREPLPSPGLSGPGRRRGSSAGGGAFLAGI